MRTEYDIAIIGGGMAGASLAGCLAGTSLRIAVIEQSDAGSSPGHDDRGLALALSSSRILDAIGVWPELAPKAIPIRHIHVSDRGHIGSVHLHADEVQLPALAHVVSARELGAALLQKLATIKNTDFIRPASVTAIKTGAQWMDVDYRLREETRTLRCRLLVAADGTGSTVRDMLGIETAVKDYRQTAIVSTVGTKLPHNYTAYERFTAQGPLAMLPMAQNRSVAVHVVAADRSADYLRMDDQQYLNTLHGEFGNRLGRIIHGGARKAYPLRLVRADRQYAERAVLLGNAAHTIHPNGAQGFNLGLRGTAALAEHILNAIHRGDDPGSARVLENWCRARADEQKKVIYWTDLPSGLFYTSDPLRAFGRNLGMLLFDLSPALKRGFIRRATGLAGRQPALVRRAGSLR